MASGVLSAKLTNLPAVKSFEITLNSVLEQSFGVIESLYATVPSAHKEIRIKVIIIDLSRFTVFFDSYKNQLLYKINKKMLFRINPSCF